MNKNSKDLSYKTNTDKIFKSPRLDQGLWLRLGEESISQNEETSGFLFCLQIFLQIESSHS